jgi:NodT family efflux transporter outer membrane factor (OMF) lipoprotein
MVGPDFHRPKMAVPNSYELPQVAEAARLSEVNGEAANVATWWDSFNDPILTSLVERAGAANLDVRSAEARVRAARAARDVTASGLLPQVNASAGYLRNRAPGIVNGQNKGIESDLYRAGLDATWEIDVFGGVRRGVEGAEAQIEFTEYDRRDALVTVASEVALNYADLRGTQDQLRVARENLTLQEQTLDFTRRRLAAGFETTRLDVANAEAQVATTRSAIPTLEAAAKEAIFNLGVLLGEEPTALEAELSEPLPIPTVPPVVPAGLPSELLERRPDIRRAEANVHVATAGVGVATADLYPKFALTGTLGFSSNELNDLLNWNGRSWSIGPSVSWPLFSGGRIRANIALNQAKLDESLLGYQSSVLNALREVQVAVENYAREQERRASLVDSVRFNREAVDMSTRLYSEGSTDFLNVLSAQRALLAAEEALTESTRALITDLVAVYKALGGGWETFEPAKSQDQQQQKQEPPPQQTPSQSQ